MKRRVTHKKEQNDLYVTGSNKTSGDEKIYKIFSESSGFVF